MTINYLANIVLWLTVISILLFFKTSNKRNFRSKEIFLFHVSIIFVIKIICKLYINDLHLLYRLESSFLLFIVSLVYLSFNNDIHRKILRVRSAQFFPLFCCIFISVITLSYYDITNTKLINSLTFIVSIVTIVSLYKNYTKTYLNIFLKHLASFLIAIIILQITKLIYKNSYIDLILLQDILYLFLPLFIVLYYVNEQSNKLKEKSAESELRFLDRQEIIEGLAHELRTPLTSLMGIFESYKLELDLLKQKSDKENISCSYNMICNDIVNNAFTDSKNIVSHISNIVSNLSTFGKEIRETECKLYNIKQLIITCIKFSSFLLSIKSLPYNMISYEDRTKYSNITCKLCPSTFLQVMQNIIKNSIDAVKDVKNPFINIKLQCLNNYISITIEDNGKGMSREEQERCFEKFYTTKKNGTGLGLYFVRKYVERLDGKIHLNSKEGVGTVIVLYIPVEEKNHSTEAYNE